jgi:hypothetical protein
MVGEPSDKALRAMLEERVHLLIRINLLENSGAKNDELARLLAKHVNAMEKQISERRCAISPDWQVCNSPKTQRAE